MATRLFVIVPPEKIGVEAKRLIVESLSEAAEKMEFDARFLLIDPDWKLIEITEAGANVILPGHSDV